MMHHQHAEDLAFAFELADISAGITLERFGDRLPVRVKDDATPVTELDVAAERAIRAAIAGRFPDDGILGEEDGEQRGTNGRLWVVDPVDGTKLFAEGIPLWTTLIGLRVDGITTLGVADAPALGDRYHAILGGGAWRGPRPLAVSHVDRLADAFVLHSSLEEWLAGGREELLRRIGGTTRRTRGLSDAWGQLLVAQGSADLLMEHEPCFAWDWSATGLIVREAGGSLTTFAGTEPSDGHDLLVSNGRIHAEALRELAPSVPATG